MEGGSRDSCQDERLRKERLRIENIQAGEQGFVLMTRAV